MIQDSAETVHLTVVGMQGPYCARDIKRALNKVMGVQSVIVSLVDNSAEVVVSRGKVTIETLIAVVTRAGSFKATVK